MGNSRHHRALPRELETGGELLPAAKEVSDSFPVAVNEPDHVVAVPPLGLNRLCELASSLIGTDDQHVAEVSSLTPSPLFEVSPDQPQGNRIPAVCVAFRQLDQGSGA